MELNQVPVEVRADIGVDGSVNLFALLEQTAQRFANRGAVYQGEQLCCTWRELRDRALHLAGSIRQQYPAGARFAIISENRPEIVELLFGIWAAECVAVPINYKLHPREMVQILDDAGVSQVFASTTIAAQLGPGCSFPVESFAGEAYSYRLAAVPAPMPCTDPSTLAWLFYTSGTTGRSKGACSPTAT
jgi:fatty-acyl-CoA synthase